MLYLCFFADGPRADNLVRLPSFPSGCSYDRPFRYRDKWIEDDLLSAMRADSDKFEGEEIVLALRFLAPEFADTYVPIRAGRFQRAALSPDQNQIYFRTGQLLDFTTTNDLADMAETIPTAHAGAKRQRLFFRLDSGTERRFTRTDDEEDAAWTRLTELIARSASLPVSPDARNALYLRFQRPRRRRRLQARKIYHSWTTGDTYGFKLPEQSTYELVVLHRIPCLIGTNTPLDERPELKFSNATELTVTPGCSEISSNYDRHVIALNGARFTKSWIQLTVKTEDASFRAGDSEILSYGLNLPLKVRFAPIYRLYTQIIPIAFVAAALFASSYYTVYKDTHHEAVPFWPSLVASFGASLVIFLFRR